MKAQDLNEFVKKATKIVSKKNTLPVIDNVLISNQKLTVFLLDNANKIEYSKEFKELDRNISALVNFEFLKKIVSKVKKGDIDLNTVGTIKTDKGIFSYEFNEAQISDFPSIEGTFEEFFSFGSGETKLLKEAVSFVANDELRPVMNMVLYSENHIVGSDAHLLYYKKAKRSPEQDFLLPKKVIDILSDDAYTIEKRKKGNNTPFGNAYYLVGDMETITYTVDSMNYPNYQAVIPCEHSVYCEVDKKDFVEKLDLASLVSNKISGLVKLTQTSDSLELSARDLDSERSYKSGLKSFKNEGEIEIGLKDKLALKCFKYIDSHILEMKMTDASRAIIWNDCILQMPMML